MPYSIVHIKSKYEICLRIWYSLCMNKLYEVPFDKIKRAYLKLKSKLATISCDCVSKKVNNMIHETGNIVEEWRGWRGLEGRIIKKNWKRPEKAKMCGGICVHAIKSRLSPFQIKIHWICSFFKLKVHNRWLSIQWYVVIFEFLWKCVVENILIAYVRTCTYYLPPCNCVCLCVTPPLSRRKKKLQRSESEQYAKNHSQNQHIHTNIAVPSLPRRERRLRLRASRAPETLNLGGPKKYNTQKMFVIWMLARGSRNSKLGSGHIELSAQKFHWVHKKKVTTVYDKEQKWKR